MELKNNGLLKLGFLLLMLTEVVNCTGKYLVKTYPAGAKVYVRELQSREKKLIGLSPLQIKEESSLGDVFFLVLEKQNYKTKEVMIRVNEGESLSIAAQLDPRSTESLEESKVADGKKDDKQQPQPKGDKKKPKSLEDLENEIDEINLRVALLENTTSFYKDAMFSSRFQGGVAKFDRDKNDNVIGFMFKAQQAIVQSKYKKASDLVDRALELDEYTSRAWLLKGSIKYLQKDYKGARIAWERTLKLDPTDKVAYRYLSSVYQKIGLKALPKKAGTLRRPAAFNEIEKRKTKQRRKRK